jgi:hypothetical protein
MFDSIFSLNKIAVLCLLLLVITLKVDCVFKDIVTLKSWDNHNCSGPMIYIKSLSNRICHKDKFHGHDSLDSYVIITCETVWDSTNWVLTEWSNQCEGDLYNIVHGYSDVYLIDDETLCFSGILNNSSMRISCGYKSDSNPKKTFHPIIFNILLLLFWMSTT